MASNDAYDVVILGGGLAGLTLAIQLKRARPETSVLVAEKQEHPVQEAAHKVGESTVLAATHYFTEVLGLEEHLKTEELHKNGLRFFFPAGDNRDIARRLEVGTRVFPAFHTYQIDRGRFENMLGNEARRQGAEFLDACRVDQVSLDGSEHRVRLNHEGKEFEVRARWVVDASGRAAILKRQLGLAKKTEHAVNAAWFRIGDRIAIDDWSDEPEWQAHVPERNRWLSTNHFMGRGYWVWLIPLPSGSHSVGILADPALHPFDKINTFDRAMAWLRQHEPQIAAKVDERRDKLQDFRVLKHFSYSCERVFSPKRWCLTGEAGVFLDPFYSPGSDIIASSNTYITHLILADLSGEAGDDLGDLIDACNDSYLQSFEIQLGLYEGQYPIWGNHQVMTAKLIWDQILYWAVPALLELNDKWWDFGFLATVGVDLERFQRLHEQVQRFFREWDALERREWSDGFIDTFGLHYADRLQRDLMLRFDDDELRSRVTQNVDLMEAIAAELFRKAAELVWPVPESQPVNPYAITLKREQWETGGIFTGGEALPHHQEIAGELNKIWLERVAVAGSPRLPEGGGVPGARASSV